MKSFIRRTSLALALIMIFTTVIIPLEKISYGEQIKEENLTEENLETEETSEEPNNPKTEDKRKQVLNRASLATWDEVQTAIDNNQKEIDITALDEEAGNIEIEIDGKDISIIGDAGKTVKGLQINLKNSGKLTIENLNINNSAYPIKEEKSAIRVLDKTENTLVLKGTNTFNNLNIKATIAVNKNENEYAKLYIQGDGYLNIIGIAEGKDEEIRKIGASIGGDFESSSGDIYIGEDGSSPKLNINLNLGGAGIGSGKDQGLNKNGTISIGGKTKIVSKRTYEEYLNNSVRYSTVGAVIGGGYDELGQRKGSSGTIIIKDDAEIDANIYGFGSAVIGQGLGTTVDKIEIKDNAKVIAINNAEYVDSGKNSSFKNINTQTEGNKTYKRISPAPLEEINDKKTDSKMVENIDEDISKGAGIGLAAADLDAKPSKDAVINIEGNPNIIAFGHGAIALGDGKININGGNFELGTITGAGLGFITGIREFGEEAETETEPANENDLNIENANIKVYAFIDSRDHNWAAGIGSRYNNDASNINIDIKKSNIYGETEDGALIGSSKTINSGTANISIVDSTIEGKTKVGSLIGSGGRIASSVEKLKRDLKNNFTIYLKNNQIKGETVEAAVIGTGSYMSYRNLEENPNKYIINIEDSKFDNNIKSTYGALIGTGVASETNMEINIKNSELDLTNKNAAVIGGGYNTEKYKTTAGDITIDGGKLNLNGIYSSAIGGGYDKKYIDLKRNDKVDGTLKVINNAEILATSLKNWENNGEFNYKEPISARLLEGSQFIMNNKSFKIDFKTLNIEDLLIKVYDNEDNFIKEFKLVDNKGFKDNRVVNKAYAYSLPKEYNNSENILTEYMEKDGKVYQIRQAEPLREENRHPKELFEFKTVEKHQAVTLEDSDLTYVELGEDTELPIDNLEVIFDGNEGKFEYDKDIHQIKVKKGSKLTEEDFKTPIREGYEFIGWTYDKEGSGEIITFEDILNLEINANKYFYAKWEKKDAPNTLIIDIIFDGNGGKVEGYDKITKHYKLTDKVLEPKTPIREGYEFKYWSYDKLGKMKYIFGRNPEIDLILYANWEKSDTDGGGETTPEENLVDTVILANGDKYTDILTATVLGQEIDAPILLTKVNSLNEATEKEIERLNPKKIIISGGDGSVSEKIVKELKTDGYKVERLSGENRYGTASEIAKRVRSITGVKDKTVLVDGTNFPDVITISTLASIKNAPILLTEPDRLNKITENTLEDFNIKNITIGGGDASVSKTIEKFLKANYKVERIGGRDRYKTASLIAKEIRKITGNKDDLILVDGTDFPDGITINSLAGKYNSPIHLTNPDKLNQITKKDIKDFNIKNILIGGGTNSVSENTLDYLKGENIKVERISGKDRYKTAVKISEKFTEK